MKKIIALSLLCCITASLFCGCSNNDIFEQEEYFSKINSIIKDLEFHTVKAKDGKIILYNDDYEPISEIPFEDYDEDIKFIAAHKDGPVVYFITAGMVDNEYGIMFINDEANEILTEVTSLERIAIGGNSYEYSTVYKFR